MTHFVRHYLEMVAAMVVGMAVFGGLGMAAGLDPPTPELSAATMAFGMSVAMTVWMRVRGHGWPAVAEMVAAMFVPVIVLSPLSLLGVISGEVLMLATHVLMLPLMFVVMLRRRAEYAR